MMKTVKTLALFIVSTLLLAACGDDDKTQSGDFGQIQVPDVSQLVQMAEAGAGSSSVAFTTLAAWSASIRDAGSEAVPNWITLQPDHGDRAGSYNVQITLRPNTGEQSRTAIITLTCGSTQIEISVTQKAPADGSDEGQERAPSGRLVRITEYENDRAEYFMTFTYDNANRLTSITTYNDAGMTSAVGSWEFSYESASRLTATEKHYDKSTVYSYTWVCEGMGLDEPNDGAMINYATVTESADPSSSRTHAFEYEAGQLANVYIDASVDGAPSWQDEGHYIYQDNSCSQIRWTKNGMQEFTYDTNVHKHAYEYERLNQLQALDPGLFFIYDSDMLRSLGLLGPTGNLLPVKVITTLTNGEKVTEDLSYTYHSLDTWQRGEEIDGMEITLRNNLGSEYRYVRTYLGI